MAKDINKNLTTAVDMINKILSKNQVYASIVDEKDIWRDSARIGKTEGNVSEVQVAKFKVVEDKGEVVIPNKKGSAIKPKMADLKKVRISYGCAEYEAVVDSGAQISVFKSSVVGKEVDYKEYIMLQPAFGDCLKAGLKEVDIGLVMNGYITPVI